MSHSVSIIRPGSQLQSKSNDSLFALHMHFPNIHIWTICFDLFFCFSNRRVCCCSHSLQAGEGVFWKCHCWGRPCYKSHGLQLHEFYHNKPTVLPLHARLPFLFQAVWGSLQQEACRQSWLYGRHDLIHTPHSCTGKLRAPRSKQLSGEFICSHMNSKSAFSISKLQRGFALWEMSKCEVCISLLGMRYKMHNPSNKDMSETASRILKYKQLCLQSDTPHSRSCTRPSHYS